MLDDKFLSDGVVLHLVHLSDSSANETRRVVEDTTVLEGSEAPEESWLISGEVGLEEPLLINP